MRNVSRVCARVMLCLSRTRTITIVTDRTDISTHVSIPIANLRTHHVHAELGTELASLVMPSRRVHNNVTHETIRASLDMFDNRNVLDAKLREREHQSARTATVPTEPLSHGSQQQETTVSCMHACMQSKLYVALQSAAFRCRRKGGLKACALLNKIFRISRIITMVP